MDIQIEAKDLIFKFLAEKFPFHDIEYIYYSPLGPQPGDYKAPEFKVAGHTLGWLVDKNQFVPRHNTYIKREFDAISIADPQFFDILHIIAIYEVGYDPLKPGSREAYMANDNETGMREYIKLHPELNIVYWSPI